MFSIKNKKGFSLTEIIVVMVIILIATNISFVAIKRNKADQSVEVAARQLAAELRSLQNESLNGKKIGSSPVCQFVMNLTNNTPDYTVTYKTNCSSGTGTSQSFKLKGAVFNVGGNIVFTPPFAQATLATGNQIKISSSADSSKSAYVCISNAGNIIDQPTVCP